MRTPKPANQSTKRHTTTTAERPGSAPTGGASAPEPAYDPVMVTNLSTAALPARPDPPEPPLPFQCCGSVDRCAPEPATPVSRSVRGQPSVRSTTARRHRPLRRGGRPRGTTARVLRARRCVQARDRCDRDECIVAATMHRRPDGHHTSITLLDSLESDRREHAHQRHRQNPTMGVSRTGGQGHSNDRDPAGRGEAGPARLKQPDGREHQTRGRGRD